MSPGKLLHIISLTATLIIVDYAYSAFAANQAHDTASCGSCHQLYASLTVKSTALASKDVSCRSCHEEEQLLLDNLSFHDEYTRSCLDCHSFHATDNLTAVDKTFQYNFADTTLSALCITCHTKSTKPANLSSGHRKALEIYHSGELLALKVSPSESCLLCHSKGSFIYDELSLSYEIPQFNEHASHPYGVNGHIESNDRTAKEVVNSTLLNGQVECQSCHNINSQSKYLLVSGDSSYNFCYDCHGDKQDRYSLK